VWRRRQANKSTRRDYRYRQYVRKVILIITYETRQDADYLQVTTINALAYFY